MDAGSSGTRAVLYRWLRRDSGPMTVFNRKGDAPFRHSWLPYIKYCGEVDVNGGVYPKCVSPRLMDNFEVSRNLQK